MDKKNKALSAIPKIYYINLSRSKDRMNYMEKMFKDFEIKNYERVEAEDLLEHKNMEFLSCTLPPGLKPVEAVVTLSHIKALKKILSSGEEWSVICEDDLDISTVNFWNFTWEDFMNNLPKNAKIVQLVVSTRESRDINFHIHLRSFWDFNATAYLIHRDQAEDIVNLYFNNGLDLSKYKSKKQYDKDNNYSFYQEKYPTVEEVIYGINKEAAYSIPLFTYSMLFESISNPEHYRQTLISHKKVEDFWSTQSKNFTIQDIMSL